MVLALDHLLSGASVLLAAAGFTIGLGVERRARRQAERYAARLVHATRRVELLRDGVLAQKVLEDPDLVRARLHAGFTVAESISVTPATDHSNDDGDPRGSRIPFTGDDEQLSDDLDLRAATGATSMEEMLDVRRAQLSALPRVSADA